MKLTYTQPLYPRSSIPIRSALAASILLVAACSDETSPSNTASSSASTGTGASGGEGGGGGGDTGGGGSGGSGPADVCLAQHDATTGDGRHAVVVCDEPYREGSAVHLPESEPTADGQVLYAWLDGLELHTVDGDTFALQTDDVVGESVRFAFTFYRVEVDGGGAVVDWRPAVVVDEAILLQPFAGRAAEGTISARVGDGEFDLEPTLPIRVRFESIEATDDLPALPAGVRKQLRVVIDNLDDGATAEDGACLPPLASHGDANPFFGATTAAAIGASSPSMHTYGDNHFVIAYEVDGVQSGSVMGGAWFPPLHPLATGAPIALGPYSGAPHGNPISIPGLELTLVSGGGDPCN